MSIALGAALIGVADDRSLIAVTASVVALRGGWPLLRPARAVAVPAAPLAAEP